MGIGRMIGPSGGPAVSKETLLSSPESCSSALVDGGGQDGRRDILVTRFSAFLDVLPLVSSLLASCYRQIVILIAILEIG